MAVLTPEQVRFLEEQRVAHLATIDDSGRPHVVPVCYALLDDVLYTPIDEKPKRGDPLSLRRIRNMLSKPHVCLVVDHYEEDWRRLAWLQVRGTASLATESDERSRGIAVLRDRYPQYRDMALEERPLIRIAVERAVEWTATLH